MRERLSVDKGETDVAARALEYPFRRVSPLAVNRATTFQNTTYDMSWWHLHSCRAILPVVPILFGGSTPPRFRGAGVR